MKHKKEGDTGGKVVEKDPADQRCNQEEMSQENKKKKLDAEGNKTGEEMDESEGADRVHVECEDDGDDLEQDGEEEEIGAGEPIGLEQIARQAEEREVQEERTRQAALEEAAKKEMEDMEKKEEESNRRMQEMKEQPKKIEEERRKEQEENKRRI